MTTYTKGIYCFECATSFASREGKAHIRANPNHHTTPVEFHVDALLDGAEQLTTPTNSYLQKVETYLRNESKWDFFKRILDTNKIVATEWDTVDTLKPEHRMSKVIAKIVGVSVPQVLANIKSITITVPVEDTELDEAKAVAKTLVDAERDRRKFLSVTYNGNLYSVSEWDMMMIMSLMITSNNGNALPTGDYWRTANNTNVNLSNTDLNNLDGLIRSQVQSSYLWSWTKKAEIEACTTVAEVEALDLELTV